MGMMDVRAHVLLPAQDVTNFFIVSLDYACGSSSSAGSSYQPIESDISAMPTHRAPDQKYHRSSVVLDISALEQITPHG
jgi:hypothetical protein